MNKSYRVLFNQALGAWVAVCETASSRGKKSRSRRIASAVAAALLVLAAAPALAGGDGGVGGAAGTPNYTGVDRTLGNNSTGAGGHGGEGEGSPGTGGAGGTVPAAVGATISTSIGTDTNPATNFSIGRNGTNSGNTGGGGGGGGDAAVTNANLSVSGSVTVMGSAGGVGGSGASVAGGGGGGGGAGIIETGAGTTITVDNAAGAVSGGKGGNGGASSLGTFGAGDGGNGGAGITATAGGTAVVNHGGITGGAGGTGGSTSAGTAGDGGAGGVGLLLGGNSSTATNTGTISGGAGGAAGSPGSSGDPGVAAAGGVGLQVTGDNNTITTSGAISGGALGGTGGTGARASAVVITGSTNKLELNAGATFNGNVSATAASGNIFALGGAANGSFAVTGLGSTITGFSTFLKEGASDWSLTGTTGAITAWNVTAGALSINSDGALGAVAGSSLLLDGGALHTTASVTSTRGITMGAAGGTINADGGTLNTFSGVLSGGGAFNGAFTKSGAGTVTLTGTNTYLGGTHVTAGTLAVGSDANLGDMAGNVSIDNGATLSATASFASARGVTLTSGGASVGVQNAGDTLTLSGLVGGAGLLQFVGAGTLALTGTNTYAGGTYVVGGTLRGDFDSFGNGAISVGTGATLELQQNTGATMANGILGFGSVSKTGTGELILSGSNSYTGGTTVSAGSLRGTATSFGTGAITLATNTTSLVLDDAGLGNVSNSIGGSGSLTKTGAGATTLSGTNSYSGGTTVQQGSLIAGTAGAFVQNAAYTVDGGTLDLNNFGLTVSSLSGGGGNIALGSAMLTVGQADNTGLTSNIGGTGGLVKTGAGVLTLFGTNTYSGGTTLEAGVLQYATPGSFASGTAYVVNGGTLAVEAGVSGSMSSLSGTGGAVQLSAGASLTVNQAGNTAFAGDLTGAGSFTKSGAGTLVLTGTTTLNSGINLDAGTLEVGTAANLGSKLTFTGVSELHLTGFASSSAALVLNAAGTVNVDTGFTLSGVVSGASLLTKTGAGGLTLSGNANTYSGGTLVSAGILAGDHDSFGTGAITLASGTTLQLNEVDGGPMANNIAGAGGLIKARAGTTTLTGNNTYSGETLLAEGTLQAGSATGLTQNTAYRLIGGSLDLNDFALSVGSLSGGSGTVDLGSATLTLNQSTNTTFGGTTTGTGGLTKSGTGELLLAGTSNYTGTTTLVAGTLKAGSATGLAQGAYVVNGGTLDLNGNALAMTSLSGAGGTVALGAAALAVNQTGSTTFAGVLTGSGGLTKSGSGTLELAGDNKASPYTGAVTISGGALQGNVQSFGTGAITDDASLIVNQATAGTLSNSVGGTGALTKIGAGELTLTGTNTYAGGTTITAGSLRGAADKFGTGAITDNASLVLDQNTAGTLANSVGGTGTVTKLGTGEVTLTGTNTYAGGTTITAGSLRGASNEFGTGTITNNASLVLDQSSAGTLANVVTGTGAVTKLGTGEVTVTATNTYAGGTTITAGSLRGNATSFGSGSITDNALLVLDQTGTATLANAITGSGNVTKEGTGTLTLTGVNTYAGVTTVNAGTLTAGNATALTANSAYVVDGGTLNLNNFNRTMSSLSSTTPGVGGAIALGGATLTVGQSGNTNFGGNIGGTGALLKSGTGSLALSGTNTYSGGTTLAAGSLQYAASSAFSGNTDYVVNGGTLELQSGVSGTVASLSGNGGTVLLDATSALTVNQTANTSFAGNLNGAGSFTKSGAGALTLTGTTTLASGIDLGAGGLVVGSAASLGSALTFTGAAQLNTTASFASSAAVTLNGASTVSTDPSTVLTLSGAVTGSSLLTKSGTGTLVLTGNSNTYSGGTAVGAGALQGDHNSFGTGAITNNAALVLDEVDGGTLANNMSGTGTLTKQGTGTTAMSGASTYTGLTTITAGTLQAASATGLAHNTAYTLSGGTLGLNGFALSVSSLAGTAGTVDLGSATLTVNQNTNTSFAGTTTGTGGLTKSGTGELLLSGTSNYTGTTTVSAGTLKAGSATGLAQGAYVVDGGTLELNGNALSVSSLSGAGGTVALGTAALTVAQAASTSFAGVLTGSGALTKSGAGTLELTGDNNASLYAGAITISGGVLQGNVQSFGTGAITSNASLVVNQTTDGTLANSVDGTGTVTKLGAGELTLTGTNAYSGGTTITAGSLRGDASRFGTGAITNNAALTVDQATAGTLANSISGTGALTKLGASELALTGTNTYSGGTTITAGALRGDASSFGTGAITDNASLVVDQATAGGLANSVSGTGTLTKLGAGELTLTGTNSYSGGTTITAGSLRGDASRFGSGAILDNARLVLDEAGTATLANAVSGSGSFVKEGGGTLTLTGANTYAGGTTVNAGILIFGNAAAAVQNSAYTVNGGTLNLNSFPLTMTQLDGTGGTLAVGTSTLTLNQNTSTVFAGTITGAATATLVKTGSGALSYAGDASAFAGTTQIDAGAFALASGAQLGGSVNIAANAVFTANGVLTGTLTVASGGRLKGTGTLGSVVLSSGATVAPGNSIGTLNIAGNFAFNAGSSYEAEVNAAGATDLIHATGTVTLGGAAVAVQAAAGSYSPLTNYTILTADGGRVGTFGSVTSNSVFLDPTLSYDANNVFLLLTRNNIDFVAVATSPNQGQSAGALQALATGNVLYDAIVPLSATDARSAFDQMSGEVHASVRSSLQQDSHFVRDAGLDRLRQAQGGVGAGMQGGTTSTTPDGGVAWGRIFGSNGHTDSDGNAARSARSIGGVLVGADQRVGDWRVGVLGGASRTNQDVDARNSTAHVDSYHLGVYGATQSGALSIRTGASYTHHNIDTTRSVAFPGVTDRLTADYGARTTQLFGELGWKLDTASGVALEPFANLAWANLRTNATTERGGVAALRLAGGSNHTLFSTLGLRAASAVDLGGTSATLRGMLGWRHASGDVTPDARMTVGGAGNFAVAGVPIARNAAVVEAGLDFALQRNLTLGISYAGQLSGNTKDHGLKATLAWDF